MERVCSNCGAVLGSDVRYCMRCGTLYASEESVPQSANQPEAVPQLVDNYGQTFILVSAINSIGSDPTNAVVVDDPGVQLLQAEIRAEESGWILVNLCEYADTRLNGQPVGEPHLLCNEDVINIGLTTLRFVVPKGLSAFPQITETSETPHLEPTAVPTAGIEQFRSSVDWLPRSEESLISAPPPQKNCNTCGSLILAEAEVCPRCGVRQVADTPVVAEKSRTTAALLAIFLGSLGAHKFYLGNIPLGILYLVFFWTYIPGFVGIIEGIYYLTLSDERFVEKYCQVL